MITWGDFRDMVRRSPLKDEGVTRWPALNLQDAVWWALDTFCAHTAVPTSVEFTGDGVTKEFTLPDNIYVSPEQAGLVTVEADDEVEYLLPVFHTPKLNLTTEQGFYVWNDQKLYTVVAPAEASTLKVMYYAYYNHPYTDSDQITIPTWAWGAVAFLTAAHAVSNRAMQESLIAQYRDKRDKGDPEDHSLQEIQSWWFKCYEAAIARVPKQNRTYMYQEKK